ncbi:MAG: ATP-binding protein [Pseudomonadota bacterium]
MIERKFSKAQVLLLAALYIVGPIVVLAVLDQFDRPDPPPPEQQLMPTAYVIEFSETPPESGWLPMADEWPRGRKQGEPFTSVWYRVTIDQVPDNPALLIAFPYAMMDVWRDGDRIFTHGQIRRPLEFPRMPMIVPLAGIGSGDILYLRMARQSSRSSLGPTYLTSVEQSLATSESIRRIHIVVPVAILAMVSAFGLAVGLMFMMRPTEAAFGWYTLTIALWVLKTAHMFVVDIPFHHFVWFSLGFVLLFLVVTELCFVNRYFEIPAPRVERALALVTVVLLAAFVVVAWLALEDTSMESLYWSLNGPIGLWFVILSCLVMTRYVVAVRKRADFDSISLFISSGVVVGVGARDLIWQVGLNGWFPPGTTYYLPYAVVVPIGLFGVQLIRRFVRDSRVATLRNEELNQLVDARTRALEHSYKKLNEEERLRVLAEERARLMRDMHDGLGGQLVQALALSERADDPDLQRSLRLALDDLRLIVDSLSPTEDGLQDLLASYRHRISKLMQRQNISVEWHIDDDVATPDLRPDAALSILRILQEAVTNAVRHSGCDRLVISLSQKIDILVLSVEDNGCGMPEDVTEHGINNMRVRANEIRAQVQVKSSPDRGTRITLLIPLEHTI